MELIGKALVCLFGAVATVYLGVLALGSIAATVYLLVHYGRMLASLL